MRVIWTDLDLNACDTLRLGDVECSLDRIAASVDRNVDVVVLFDEAEADAA